ncbi:MAG: hypothetical protein J6Y60_03555 [Treponema sp.]|nr:hypothetical protein [Treponema sp.]
MALEFNTIGIKLKYVIEASAGTRPTSGYTEIPDIKEIPEINMSPSNLDVTNLVDEYKRYIPGVKDAGNDIALTANLTANLKTIWASLVTAADTAWQSGKATWFEVAIPNFDSFYFAGVPTEMGVSSMGVDAVVEAQLHIIPNQIAGWAAAST